jgi:AAA15 family ATPase/GTPase
MRLKRLAVENFRGLQSVTLKADAPINVLVGPNAIGKSTLLTAIRLAKTILAPRISNEGNHTLVEIGVLSPNNSIIGSPGTDIAAAANVINKPI